MPPAPTYDCGHERRPGTTVCLQCRQQQISWSARRQRRILGVGVAMVALVGVLAVVVMKGIEPETGIAGDRETPVTTVDANRQGQGELAAAETRPATSAPAAGALVPVVAEGRTELSEGMYAIRSGDSVMVHFDTPDARTRRRDKLDRTLRVTLRQVYGAPMDSLLRARPENLLGGRGIFGDVTATGLRIALPGGGALTIWPQTRPGQEGPLVISYVAVPAR